VLASTSRHRWPKVLWAIWPAWVWFCVMATANHFLLDVVAGIFVATVSLAVVWLGPRLFRSRAPEGEPIADLL
jgi:hypothetical protein